MKKFKIAFDIGGVLSKYPKQFRLITDTLQEYDAIDIHIISDMYDEEKIYELIRENKFDIPRQHIHSANYKKYGEACKAKLCEDLEIDILIDDFIGYLADGKHIRLLVMPDSSKPYYSDEWKTDGSEGDFGRHYKKD